MHFIGAKTKLVMLVLSYFREFVKNSIFTWERSMFYSSSYHHNDLYTMPKLQSMALTYANRHCHRATQNMARKFLPKSMHVFPSKTRPDLL